MPKAQVDDIDREVGTRIEREREFKQLGRPALGLKVDLSAMQLFKYEKGLTRITVSVLVRIAKALGVPILLLIEGGGLKGARRRSAARQQKSDARNGRSAKRERRAAR